MKRTMAIRFGAIALAYCAAVFVSAMVAVIIALTPMVAAGAESIDDVFPAWFAFGLVLTALYALPGFAMTVLVAETKARRGRIWFVVAGVLTALAATLIASRGHGLFPDHALNIGILLGGAAGGLAYWGVSGRSSGAWREGQG